MPYKNPLKEKLRSQKRRAYFREYRRKHPQINKKLYISHGESVGYKGEMIALKLLIGSKKINRPCDLFWNGKYIDVKTARPTKTNGNYDRWKFLLSKQKNKVDLFLLIRKDKDDRVIDIHLLPNEKIKGKNISFNNKTVIKYSTYLLTLQ